MKNKIKQTTMKYLKKIRGKSYQILRRPRIYYDSNPSLKNYGLPIKNLENYKQKQILFNIDCLEVLKKLGSKRI